MEDGEGRNETMKHSMSNDCFWDTKTFGMAVTKYEERSDVRFVAGISHLLKDTE